MKTIFDDEISNFQSAYIAGKQLDENVSTSNWHDFFHVSESIHNELNVVRNKIKEMEK